MKCNAAISFLIVRTLHRMTARAMGVPFQGGTPALLAYAAFTQEQLSAIPESELPAVRERMYRAAFQTGRRLRSLLFIRSDARARRVLFWLYRNIGIELEGACPGSIRVRRCFFSDFYSPEMCRVMSAMDSGIFAGLFGGGKLSFDARITEGCPCCLAAFTREKSEV